MTTEVCSYTGCLRPKGKRRGFCTSHYNRWLKGMDMQIPLSRAESVCDVDNCGQSVKARGYCHKHYSRYLKHGDPTVVKKPGWKAGTRWSSNVGYREMHKRLDRVFGLARTYDCVDCGKPASQWSYTRDDVDERIGFNGCVFSVYPEHYTPRCTSCHKRFDLRMACV